MDIRPNADTAAPWSADPPFAGFLGIKTLSAADGAAETSLDCRVDLTNRKGDFHGGALASLLDFTLSLAVRSALVDFRGVSTINHFVNFIAPAVETVAASGRVVKLGRSIAWAEGAVKNSSGTLIATAATTFRIIR